jgi:acyl carrier protein
MADKVCDVIAQVLGISIENLTDEDSPDTIESWDSLVHINLVLALEAEFDVSLSPDDVAEMLSVGLVRKTLLEHGVIFNMKAPS